MTVSVYFTQSVAPYETGLSLQQQAMFRPRSSLPLTCLDGGKKNATIISQTDNGTV